MKVVLASTSPRRRELLKKIIPVFEVLAPQCSEALTEGFSPEETAKVLAMAKFNSVEKEPDTIYVAADTVVEIDGRLLGKPRDEKDAIRMLTDLSGRWHRVHTGVVVGTKESCVYGVKTTEIKFMELSQREIELYVKTNKPLDKAGAYGIQDQAEIFVEEIRGSYSNVVGLPLNLTYKLLKQMGYRPTRWLPLKDVASIVRSKNAGPFEVTFDIMFSDKESYEKFKKGNYLTKELFAKLYGYSEDAILVFEYFDQALALKITAKRKIPSGSVGDEDVYAAQQHVPLMNLMIPWD